MFEIMYDKKKGSYMCRSATYSNSLRCDRSGIHPAASFALTRFGMEERNSMKKYLAFLLLLTLVLSTVSCKREKEQGSDGNLSQDSAISNFDSDLSENSVEEESAENSTEESQEESREESSEESGESETAPVTEGSEAPLPEESLTQENSSESTALSLEEIQSLDGKQETWGPGKNVDDKNRPTACIQLQEKYGQYGAWFIQKDEPKVYLTFDEGYENGYTAAILDVLKEKQVSAVFFVTMPYVKKDPDLIQRMIDEGHAVGNHTVHHPNMTEVSVEKGMEEIQGLHDYVKENFQYDMYLFRNPEGAFSPRVLALTQSVGYQTVLWSFAYRDWDPDNQPDPTSALEKTVEAAHPGAIYLLHAVSKTNAEILGDFIDQVRAKGYTFATWDSK